MSTAAERRRHLRYALPSMYTRIAVRPMDSDTFLWEGHAYDISIGGVCFELDRGIEPGTPVSMQIELPDASGRPWADRRPVYVFGTIVWLEDEDEPGPVRLAAVFRSFARAGDEHRLLRSISSGQFAQAA